MKYSEAEIAGMLSRPGAMFDFRRYLLVSNVSHGLLPWEADLIACTELGYLSEIEIKTSPADLKRDADKRKWRFDSTFGHSMIKARWFAITPEVYAHPKTWERIPEHAGVLVCDPKAIPRQDRLRVERKPTLNPNARPLTPKEMFQLARLGNMRYWAKLAREATKVAMEADRLAKAQQRAVWAALEADRRRAEAQ